MPPVRWKLIIGVAVCFLETILQTDAQDLQDSIAMTADGWRPIVGTRKPTYYDFITPTSEIISTIPPSTTPSPPTYAPGSKNWGLAKPINVPGRKKNAILKLNPYYALPNRGNHGPHIPLNAVTHGRPGYTGQLKKYPSTSKPHILVSTNGKRKVKPVRLHTTPITIHDDMIPASVSPGPYNTIHKAPVSNVKVREASGLAVAGSNHYPVKQPHSHLEYNRFALPSNTDSVYLQYNTPQIHGFLYSKPSQTKDVNFKFQKHNDEYSQNLVPPPLYKVKESSTIKNEIKNKRQQPVKAIPNSVKMQIHQSFKFPMRDMSETAVQVEVTKENVNTLSNNPSNFNEEFEDYTYHNFNNQPTEVPNPTYEVTEEKEYKDMPTYTLSVSQPSSTPKPYKRRQQSRFEFVPFLPTPYQPEPSSNVVPTSPTQNEISTVFAKLSKLHRGSTSRNPNDFTTIEVSTHYPILGKPIFNLNSQSAEVTNDITTEQIEEITTTRKPMKRRRRPIPRKTTTSTTTTTTTTEIPFEMESYEMGKSEENETYEIETEAPVRQRRPSRYRTSTASSMESEEKIVHRGRNRYRHQYNEEPKRRPTPSSKRKMENFYRSSTETFSSDLMNVAMEKSSEIEDGEPAETIEIELPDRHYITENPKIMRYETIRPHIITEAPTTTTTTEREPTTHLLIPENEIDHTPEYEETTTVSSTTTTSTTTTTAAPSPTRVRGRPLKFDNSNRPRFSVKDYRQKLSQYSSTTPDPYKSTSDTARVRIPNRFRKPSTVEKEEPNEVPRNKFVPKEPRQTNSKHEENGEAIITDKIVKSVNTRLRPFGRYRSTTTTTTPPKVSIKPNLFTRRRPPMINGLKTRIQAKQNKTEPPETTTMEPVTERFTTEEIDVKESRGSTFTYESSAETTTQSIEENDDSNMELEVTTKHQSIDPYSYSQRVSDLTSSAKNDYNIPGLFKSVAPISRRIPSYFTIVTDDPILPIEAFFPNLKDKTK